MAARGNSENVSGLLQDLAFEDGYPADRDLALGRTGGRYALAASVTPGSGRPC
jgi:hypothetical protein